MCERAQGLDDVSDDDDVAAMDNGWDEDEKDSAAAAEDEDVAASKPVFMPVSEVESQLKLLWKQEEVIVSRIWGRKFGTYAKKSLSTDNGCELCKAISCSACA